jgi:hypothetical protein
MAGTSTKTEVITLRVPVGVASVWRLAAERSGVPIGKYVQARAERSDLEAECERLRAEVDQREG